MKECVNVRELLEEVDAMAKRGTLLARGGVTQEDLAMQISDIIIHVATKEGRNKINACFLRRTEHSKKSKEELVQEIMSLEEIECSDRCFANECESGTTIYNINELFSELKELKYELFSALKEQNQEETYKKVTKVYELMDIAEGNWNYVKNGIAEINDDSRCSKALKDFKSRVAKASDDNDSI